MALRRQVRRWDPDQRNYRADGTNDGPSRPGECGTIFSIFSAKSLSLAAVTPGASLHGRWRIILGQLHQHPLQSNPVELCAGPVFVVDAVSNCQRVYVFASLQIREFKAKLGKFSIVPVSQAFHPVVDGLDDGGSRELAQPIEELRVQLFPEVLSIEISDARFGGHELAHQLDLDLFQAPANPMPLDPEHSYVASVPWNSFRFMC